MTTLSVGQMWDNDAPTAFKDVAVVTNVWGELDGPATPGNQLRIRQLEISGDFALGALIEIGENETVKLNYYWDDVPIIVTFPGAGWLLAADADLDIRHQEGSNAIVAVNIWRREETP